MKVRNNWGKSFTLNVDIGKPTMGVFMDEKTNNRSGTTVSERLYSIYNGVAVYF